MLELMDIGVENAVAYRLGGKLTDAEMNTVFSVLREKIDEHGKVSIYQEVESFKGVELDGMIEKVKFFMDVGISKFDKIAVVVGSEEKGIRPLVKKNCDLLVSIPQVGAIDSLNASVAGGILLYEAFRQRR